MQHRVIKLPWIPTLSLNDLTLPHRNNTVIIRKRKFHCCYWLFPCLAFRITSKLQGAWGGGMAPSGQHWTKVILLCRVSSADRLLLLALAMIRVSVWSLSPHWPWSSRTLIQETMYGRCQGCVQHSSEGGWGFWKCAENSSSLECFNCLFFQLY